MVIRKLAKETGELLEREMPATKVSVASFGIEADDPRNCDLLIQSIPNCRLRSAISGSKPTIVNKQDPHNSPVVPRDQAARLGTLPPLPGMQLHVNPSTCTYRVVDPLHGDEALCARIKRNMEEHGAVRSRTELDGVPPQKGVLDPHRLKTLVREMVWIVESGSAKVVKGSLPSMEDVEALPGNFLLNPGSRVPNTQPRYEKDLEAWVEKMGQTGG